MKLVVKKLLKERNKTKYWLSKQLGTSWQNIDNFVNNRIKSITYDRIEALCQIFDCMPSDLFDYKKTK